MIVLLTAAAAAVSGLGPRAGLWPFRFGFKILQAAAIGAAGGALLSFIGLVWPQRGGERHFSIAAIVGLVLGGAVVGYPVYLIHLARSVPPIHDITTDTRDPPAFMEIAELRADAENSMVYPGGEIAAMQRKAYPDIKPARFNAPPDKVFDVALATARAMGWTIVAAVPADGRIEATDTTFWYHFTDDIAIRIRAEGQGTRVDLRSESRVGRSDLGTNARRIRRYLAALDQQMAASGG
ncbi:MAG TPA: DUF1499 domain-containing protein [Alphaproteobacteria bacterium]|nr:DUF1499 domain-containing protein [Alphaproteobacteria bacterium]